MGFLSPLFLLAAVAVAVPLVLHLVHRHETRRVAFPALRYLLRTEREHARRIRFRQLLLLLLRVAVMLLLVLAGARLFVRGAGGAHEPTALAIVLDNSLSTSRLVGEERLLDRLKALAEATLDLAGPDDRIWVIRAGEPWEVVTPGDAAAARRRVRETDVSAASSDLPGSVARAAGLVRDAGLPAAEVQVLSDLQATAFPEPGAGPAPSPVSLVVYRPPEQPPVNRHVAEVLVGGGLAPLAGRRSEVGIRVEGPGADGEAVPLRLVVGERIRAAAHVPLGTVAVLPFGPFPAGWIEGYVETDPDALRADDRRWFARRVRPPPTVIAPPATPPFLAQALDVLEESGRIRRAAAGAADVAISAGSGGTPEAAAQVVVPPADAALLPALNRRLAGLGVPWRYETAPAEGETTVASDRTTARLEGIRVRRAYRLVPSDDASVLPEQVLARLADGAPWLVEGPLPQGGRYRLMASPFVPEATELPVSASMVPLMEWLLTPSGRSAGEAGLLAGESLALPASATAVETPGGTRVAVDGTRVFRATREPGVHVVLAGDSVLERVAVNPPPRESLLAPVPPNELEGRLGGRIRTASDARSWSETVFTSRQGPELWRPLLLAALVLLLVEGWVAASGRTASAPAPRGSRATRREDRAPAA